jgi:hypothetical protein
LVTLSCFEKEKMLTVLVYKDPGDHWNRLNSCLFVPDPFSDIALSSFSIHLTMAPIYFGRRLRSSTRKKSKRPPAPPAQKKANKERQAVARVAFSDRMEDLYKTLCVEVTKIATDCSKPEDAVWEQLGLKGGEFISPREPSAWNGWLHAIAKVINEGTSYFFCM